MALLLVSCARPAYQEQGWASYIADQYAGRMTSSGQPYYPLAYTAAHTSLPFGTELTVKNLYTNRSVRVTVNDRFPYYPGRVVNLSRAAAEYIGMPQMQLAQVQVTAKKLPQPVYAPTQSYQQPVYAQQQPTYQQPTYQPQPAYQPAPMYQPQAPQQAPSYARQPAPVQPRYTAPAEPIRPSPGAPNAPAFNGSGGPPPGLKTF